MCARLFLLATALLTSCPGGASENSVSREILAIAGETVVLPCRISVSNDVPTVEWSKEGLDPGIVFLYRTGFESYEAKNPAFQYRTNLFMNELKNGNISLRISNLRLSDAGKYKCKTVRKLPLEVETIELVVVAVSEPKLSVVPALDGALTLQCEAKCWYPKPELTFLDEQGHDIRAEEPKSTLHSWGCFTVTRRATLQTASNRVTCRVHQPDKDQTRVADIYIPADWMKSCTLIIIIAAILGAITLGMLIALICRMCGNCVGRQKELIRQASEQSTAHSDADVYPQRNQADNDRNATTEHQREKDDLMLKLQDKEETIRKLKEELNDLRSKQSPVVCQHGQPTFDNSPSKSSPDVSKTISPPPHNGGAEPAGSTSSNRPNPGRSSQRKNSNPDAQIPAPGPQKSHRSPVLWTDDDAASPSSPSAHISEKKHIDRTVSFSRPRPQNIASVKRRDTISIFSNNRFSVLERLSDEEEPLVQ